MGFFGGIITRVCTAVRPPTAVREFAHTQILQLPGICVSFWANSPALFNTIFPPNDGPVSVLDSATLHRRMWAATTANGDWNTSKGPKRSPVPKAISQTIKNIQGIVEKRLMKKQLRRAVLRDVGGRQLCCGEWALGLPIVGRWGGTRCGFPGGCRITLLPMCALVTELSNKNSVRTGD